jgi:hypothetical protein
LCNKSAGLGWGELYLAGLAPVGFDHLMEFFEGQTVWDVFAGQRQDYGLSLLDRDLRRAELETFSNYLDAVGRVLGMRQPPGKGKGEQRNDQNA